MRRLFAGLIASLMIAQPTIAAERCAVSAEQSMFELAALKAELLVVAISCQRNDSYNAFVQRYRTTLMALDKELNAHFKRHNGARWQKVADDFTTEMANARATLASRLGTDLCPRNSALFSEVMSLSGPADLPAYAAGKDLVPAAMTSCTTPKPARPIQEARAASSRSRSASPRH